jgi:hypothetical protein
MTRIFVSARIPARLRALTCARAVSDGCTVTSVVVSALERYAVGDGTPGGCIAADLVELEAVLARGAGAPTRLMTWRLPVDLLDRVGVRSAEEGRTLTSVIVEGLALHVAPSPAEVAGRLAVRLLALTQGAA